MISKDEFIEWKALHGTEEFFKYLAECRQNLMEQPTMRDTSDLTVQSTCYKQGQMDMLQSMLNVDFAGD